MISITVKKDITITSDDVHINAISKAFCHELVFDNPEYYKKIGLGKWTGNTPKQIRLYKTFGNSVILPFGMLPKVFKQMRGQRALIVNNTRADIGKIDYKSSVVPYDYQEEAIQAAIKARQGVIVAPCGSGKTQIGLEIIARLGGRALWLTHTADLLKQSMERAHAVFGLNKDDYGTITDGKVNVGNAITFATVQTMSKIDLQELEHFFDVVIVDEAHHIAGTPTKIMMFYKVISALAARYKYGLTATPTRADGLIGCMYALLGDEVYRITQDDVKSTTCKVECLFFETKYEPDFDKALNPDGTLNYNLLLDNIIANDERNKRIVSDIKSISTYPCLVLTDRVRHTLELKRLITADGGGVECMILSASAGKKEREEALEKMRDGGKKVLVATYALAREGLDVPMLKAVFMATPQKNEAIITQAAGRVARKADGKDVGTIVDYIDGSRLLKKWAKKRENIYKKLGYDILLGSDDYDKA